MTPLHNSYFNEEHDTLLSPVEEFALNAMRNAGPGAQAMSLTPDRGQEGNTLARLPSPLPHTATIRTPLPISRTRKGIHPTLPNTTTHRKAMSLTPGLDGARRRRVGRAGCYVL